jgi:hypothetical protein
MMIAMMKTEYSTIWEQLEREATNERNAHILVRRIIPESKLDAYIGVEHPDSKRLFALDIEDSIIERMDALPLFKGLDIVIRSAVSEKSNRSSLLVILKSPRFSDLFSLLIDDISTELLETHDEQTALMLTITRLVEWQQFAEQGDKDGLSDDSRRGLFGELYLIHNHILPKLGAVGVNSWKGFTASQQDFYIDQVAIEVKTCIAKQHQKLTISSERQLDDSFYERLYLYHLSLDAIEAGAQTLPSLIDDIRKAISDSPNSLQYFNEGLDDVGYLDEHKQMYESVGYEIREENVFLVGGEFPRILESELRPGVGDVRYSISIAECKHSSVELSALDDYLEKTRNGN